jgi:AcrR family transcriptional regulator
MAMTGTNKDDVWIEAGLSEIAETGIEGTRVEVLAKRLGVTKGGFYRRFKDRRALLDAILSSWSAGRIAAIEKQASLDGGTARERLKALVRLYSERINPHGMAVELAIRQWARSDTAAAAAVANVDAARLKNVAQLYRASGLAADEAEAQAFLFYCFIFGQSLLHLERGPRQRAQLIAACADRLIDLTHGATGR